MDIICAGEMLIDFTPMQQQGTYKANPGGAPANVAIATARNGLDTAFLGILGNDDFGKKLQGVLEEDHVKMLCPDLTDKAITTLALKAAKDLLRLPENRVQISCSPKKM